jgi:peptidoglycan/xylan/chitin deacetylase (PgdA/CDA1 family)
MSTPQSVRKVTLTFDNGPEPLVTPCVLDCLARHDLKATFFVLGRKVSEPVAGRIALRAHEEGHRIGNHTFTHSTPLGELDRTAALQEFDRTEEALAWLDREERLFRPYGGRGTMGPHLLHPAVVERLVTGGYTCVLWNSVPGDWQHPEDWVNRALEDCRTRSWSLVVLHDLPTGAMAHLDLFIRRLADVGVEITQDYPPDCVPIAGGRIVLPIEQYVSKRNT